MTKMFKPQLAPNDLLSVEEADKLNKEEYFIQPKIDGIRGVFIDGDIKSRSLKTHGNENLPSYFNELATWSISSNIYVDGEFYSPSIEFNELSGIIRSFEKPLPEDLVFLIFDIYDPNNPKMGAIERQQKAQDLFSNIPNTTVLGNLEWPLSFSELFSDVLNLGHEGLMVKKKDAPYKCGRGTYKQGIIYKMKPYETFDCIVTGFEQATVVREGAEKTTNELGRSVTSKKKDDRVLIESCSALWVDFGGLPLKVSLASLKHLERAAIWENQVSYLGKYVEFKGMMVGAKDLPRHPMFIRWRFDK